MHNEEGCGDVFGVGEGGVVDVPLQVLPGQTPTLGF